MNRREKYVPLELSGENLEKFVADLRDKLLNEFWAELPNGQKKNEIKARLEKSILQALESKTEKTQAV